MTAAPSVTPVYFDASPTCADLGYPLALNIFGVSGPFSGTWVTADGNLSVTGSSTDGVHFSFTATRGVDVVLVKGGSATNAYPYAQESWGDADLVAPNGPSGSPEAINHVKLCYDYEVEVAQSAVTSIERTWGWSIDKTSATTALQLAIGQSHAVDYVVTVSPTFQLDGSFQADGSITISNPSPVAAVLTGVVDQLGGALIAVNCPFALPFVLDPAASAQCTWSALLPDGATRTNVVEVTTSGTVGGNIAEAIIDFALASVRDVDGCAVVSDDHAGPLGTTCVAEGVRVFNYALQVGPWDASVCGTPFQFVNVASCVADDSGATAFEGHSIDVTVTCPPQGCTLTQGYWKTHSSYGPAPYDDAWALLPAGANTAFFGSGLSWHAMFWTAPRGSGYVILAHQYMAATLNGLNGASTAAVAAQLASAQALLSTYTPATLPAGLRGDALALASALDDHNSGHTGPGHCSE